jgi:hypothetical protein
MSMANEIMLKRQNWFTRNYFLGLSVTVLLLGLIAFSDNFLFDVGQESNSDPAFIIHGILMYSWFITVVIQTNHIRKLNTKAHRRLGVIGFFLAALMIAGIGYLFASGTPYSELPFFGKANRIFFPVFGILILLAYLKRDKPEFHKHAIIVGILLLMEPLLSRAVTNVGANAETLAPVIWLILWLSLFIYDLISHRRIHFLTWTGLIYWFAVYAFVM